MIQDQPFDNSSNNPEDKPSSDDLGDKKKSFIQQRLLSLDVYRGLIMITLAFGGFGLAKTAGNMLKVYPDSEVWKEVKHQFTHVEWTGCGYWDLIQPSFMFMVGVAMAFSYAKRQRLGQSYGQMLFHAITRSLILIVLGIFLISNWRDSTNWSLMNVLTQIGLGYTFLFLVWGRSFAFQGIIAFALLVFTGILFWTFPTNGIDLQTGNSALGVSADWAQEHLQGIDPHWHKNSNVGHYIDVIILNAFPRNEPFFYNRHGYQTINFIPSLATMIFGLMAGELLRSKNSASSKLLFLLGGSAIGFILGLSLHWTGICPLVKKIWTPSWTLFSTGWCCLILSTLYGLIDMLKIRFWTFPFIVVGVNSIAIYCLGQLLKPWTERTLKTHFGSDIFQFWGYLDSWGPIYEPAIQSVMIGLVFWLICFWMYRQKIFVRI